MATFLKVRNKKTLRACGKQDETQNALVPSVAEKIGKKFCAMFFQSFLAMGEPHAQNKKSGRSKSLCYQIFSSVRRLELKKTKKNENYGNRQNIGKNR